MWLSPTKTVKTLAPSRIDLRPRELSVSATLKIFCYVPYSRCSRIFIIMMQISGTSYVDPFCCLCVEILVNNCVMKLKFFFCSFVLFLFCLFFFCFCFCFCFCFFFFLFFFFFFFGFWRIFRSSSVLVQISSSKDLESSFPQAHVSFGLFSVTT